MVTCQKNLGSFGIKFFFLTIGKTGKSFPVPESDISFSKFPVSRHLLKKLFYDENTQFSYLLCSQFRQKASG